MHAAFEQIRAQSVNTFRLVITLNPLILWANVALASLQYSVKTWHSEHLKPRHTEKIRTFSRNAADFLLCHFEQEWMMFGELLNLTTAKAQLMNAVVGFWTRMNDTIWCIEGWLSCSSPLKRRAFTMPLAEHPKPNQACRKKGKAHRKRGCICPFPRISKTPNPWYPQLTAPRKSLCVPFQWTPHIRVKQHLEHKIRTGKYLQIPNPSSWKSYKSYIYLSIDRSIDLSIYLSIHPSIHLSIYPPIYSSIYPAIIAYVHDMYM